MRKMADTSSKSWAATVLTLYPDMFPGTLGQSLAGKALHDKIWALETVDIRDFARDKHRNVDDTPAGGGAGMVMRADVVGSAIDHVYAADVSDDDPDKMETRPLIYLSPRGKPLTQARVRTLSKGPGVVLLCGRFEGVDERVLEARQVEEISLGDYILSGGEPAALTLLDAVVRVLPGVMGKQASGEDESFETGLLEYPHYTRPAIWEEQEIPAVLTSGNHKKVAEWRQAQSEELTRARRPDLWEKFCKESRQTD